MPDLELIESDRVWLASRPEFSDWPAISGRIAGQINEWLDSYRSQVFASLPTSEVLDECRNRIWRAWFSFWKETSSFVQKHGHNSPSGNFHVNDDGFSVAESVRQGIRPTTGRSMGGDPFHDVVLALGAMAGDSLSIERLQSEYEQVFDEETVRAGQIRDSSVWYDLVQDLVFRFGPDSKTIKPGKLASYRGTSPLRAWLRIVIRNYLIDRSRLKTIQIARIDPNEAHSQQLLSAFEDPGASASQEELLEHFKMLLAQSLSCLTQVQQSIVFMEFRERWQNQTIATILRISPGNVTRQRKKAVDRLVKGIEEGIERESHETWNEATATLKDELCALPKPKLVEALLGGLDLGYRIGSASSSKLLPDGEESAMSLGELEDIVRKPFGASQQRQRPRALKTHRKPASQAVQPESRVVEPANATLDMAQPVASADATISIESMLPSRDRLHAVGLAEAPESVFEQGCAQDSSSRWAVLCIDARNENINSTDNWLRTFLSVMSEQFEDTNSNGISPWTPALAVALPAGLRNPSEEWTECFDIDWLVPQECDDDVRDLYLNAMRKRLTRFLGGAPKRRSNPPPLERLVRYEDMLTDSQKAGWEMTVEDDEAWIDE